jgi:hypothetical protein
MFVQFLPEQAATARPAAAREEVNRRRAALSAWNAIADTSHTSLKAPSYGGSEFFVAMQIQCSHPLDCD